MNINKWQVQEVKHWNGPLFDPELTLKSLWLKQPEKIRKAMVKLNAYYGGKTLEDQLEEIGTKYVDSISDFYYEVIGDPRRNVQLIEARYNGNVVTDTDEEVGLASTDIELVFGEDMFFEGEIIVGEKNEKYQLKVVTVQPEGDNVRYIVRCFGSTKSIPGAELLMGKKFSKEYAPVERGLSREVGGIARPGYAKVRGSLSTIRIDHKIAGDIEDYGQVMGIPALDKNGKEHTVAVMASNEQWLVEKEFSEYKNKVLAYGRTNMDENGEYHDVGVSGRYIKMGPGLREQLEQTNCIYYNQFSLEMLESILMTLSVQTNAGKEFIIQTGQGGARLFHKAVLNTTSGWTALVSDGNAPVIMKTNSNVHPNSLKAGFQFTEYLSSNGVTVRVELSDMYDDPVRNKIKMPGTQLPAESYRMDIIYKGTKEDPNIQKLMFKGQARYGGEYTGFSSGFRNPFTKEMNVNYMSTSEDSATITKFAHLGVVVYNPDTCASLIPSILQ